MCEGEEHEEGKYGDWMVVKRKKRPTRGKTRYPDDNLGAMDTIGVMNTQSTPREANSDYGRDGKRKAVNLDGAGELRAVNTQLVWPNRNQASSKGNRSELASTKSETRKPYQGKFSLDRGGVSNSNRWDKATWPINPPLHVNSPSEDKLP